MERAEELVAASGCGDELQVVGHQRVVHEGVSNHGESVEALD